MGDNVRKFQLDSVSGQRVSAGQSSLLANYHSQPKSVSSQFLHSCPRSDFQKNRGRNLFPLLYGDSAAIILLSPYLRTYSFYKEESIVRYLLVLMSTSNKYFFLIFYTILQGAPQRSHFTDEEIELWCSCTELICPKSHRWLVAKRGFQLRAHYKAQRTLAISCVNGPWN